MTARWYVVEAEEGRAEHAYLQLATAGVKVYMPLLQKRTPARRGPTSKVQAVRPRASRKDVYTPRFGRYLFVQVDLTPDIEHGINIQKSVRGMLVPAQGQRPCPLPDNYMDWLRAGIEDEQKPKENPYAIGDVVRILDGPFGSFTGKVEGVDNAGVVKVGVEILGRVTPVLFEVAHVEMVKLAKSRAMSSALRSHSPRAA